MATSWSPASADSSGPATAALLPSGSTLAQSTADDELAEEIACFFPADPVRAAADFVTLLRVSGFRPAAGLLALSPEYFSRPPLLAATAEALVSGLRQHNLFS
jgi:hypothetical protein